MKNLVVRTLSGIVMVWLVLEGTAAGGVWYNLLWGAIFALSMGELLYLLRKNPVRNSALWRVGGLLYIAQAACVVYLLRDDWEHLIALLTMVWANDVGAYLVGVSIGKHKMAPKISPKKSWEGFFGGLVFAVAVALIWFKFFFVYSSSVIGDDMTMATILWGVLGLLVGLSAVVGDLIESAFKRKLGVKDSGKIIPGHGGMLDRFDALFLAAPIFYITIQLIEYLLN